MRTEYIFKEEMRHLLAALMPANRLALEVSLETGLRIGDVLRLKTDAIASRFSVQEEKTGKRRRVFLSADLLERCKKMAGPVYVFSNRLDGRRHRTRQAVWKDLKRVCRIFRLHMNLAPHSCRKIYAVEAYKRYGGDMKKVQKLLNHDNEAVTMLYCLADELTRRRNSGMMKRTEARV